MAKVMIVDDDTTTVTLLETLLELDGFQVIAVERGGDVIPQVEAHAPDLIMIDYHLTDMDGVDAIRALRDHSDATLAATPIVMASGMDLEDEALAAGADTFIVKPFEPSELPTLFNSLIYS